MSPCLWNQTSSVCVRAARLVSQPCVLNYSLTCLFTIAYLFYLVFSVTPAEEEDGIWRRTWLLSDLCI